MVDSEDNWREYIEYRRGADITHREEETQVDHVKMEMMPEKFALAEGRHREELIIRHIVCTAVRYRSIRWHGAQVNSGKLTVQVMKRLAWKYVMERSVVRAHGEGAVQRSWHWAVPVKCRFVAGLLAEWNWLKWLNLLSCSTHGRKRDIYKTVVG